MKARIMIWCLVMATVAMVFGLLSCSKKGGNGGEDDGNTPYNIIDLRVAKVTDSSITIIWTATGDDADVGTATYYDVRLWDDWLTMESWDSATQVQGEPHPRPAGQTDSMEVRGLMKDSTYYIGLRAGDEAGNWNAPSCVRAVCFEDVIVNFPDTAVETAVRLNISKPTGDIHRSDVMNMWFLVANSANVTNLTGLEYCTSLAVLFMSSNSITNLTPLASLKKLNDLQLVQNDISDITPLASITNLQNLYLRDNHLTEVPAVSGLNRLHILDIGNNYITDLAPLVANAGLATADTVYLTNLQLSQQAIDVQIPALQARGVQIIR